MHKPLFIYLLVQGLHKKSSSDLLSELLIF